MFQSPYVLVVFLLRFTVNTRGMHAVYNTRCIVYNTRCMPRNATIIINTDLLKNVNNQNRHIFIAERSIELPNGYCIVSHNTYRQVSPFTVTLAGTLYSCAGR